MATTIKAVAAVAIAALMAYLSELAVPVIVLLVVMCLDYASGLTKAWINKEICSRVGVAGIAKKVSLLLLVAVGVVVDYVLLQGVTTAGLELPIHSGFGMVVTIWLIINECISILENAAEIGLPVPEFLQKILKIAKNKTETIEMEEKE